MNIKRIIGYLILSILIILNVSCGKHSTGYQESFNSVVTTTTIAGSGSIFPGRYAFFESPLGVAVDNDGSIIVADQLNDKIRKIDSNGVVTTIAGSTEGYADGVGTNAEFNLPVGVAIDKDGAIIVADYGNNRIRKIEVK